MTTRAATNEALDAIQETSKRVRLNGTHTTAAGINGQNHGTDSAEQVDNSDSAHIANGTPKKRMILYAFMMGCSGHQSPGLWTHPSDRSAHHNRLTYWTDHAKLLESGKFDGIFLADVLGGYDVYGGNLDGALVSGAQFPIIDPMFVVPAMASCTTNLSFGVTATTSYVHPYELARRFSTLDHLTGGRVGWNVVTGYLDSAARQFGLNSQNLHAQRYKVAHEYMDVVYKLWESSWREDAVQLDRTIGLYTDPRKVRGINHKGEFYPSVPGPHICSPSPQRTPTIFQAGSSGPGMEFAGKHAEVIFIAAHNPQVAKKRVQAARQQAVAHGRAPDSIKVLALLCPIIGRTEEEAKQKYDEYLQHGSDDGALALFGGWTGIDLSGYADDEELLATHETAEQSNAIKSAVQNFASQDPSVPKWTKKTIADKIKLGGLGPTIVGSAESIADQLEHWMEESDVDGFNVAYALAPGTFQDFTNLVTPILQARGRVWKEYPSVPQTQPHTLPVPTQEDAGEEKNKSKNEASFGAYEPIGITTREKLYGVGQKKLRTDHYATKFSWNADQEAPPLD